ncbi:enoyl-[acyl-carrier protein] reductase II [Lactobacillus colini]|uniref:Probable nitronate monooxygenase n=1 Tax=Lactobacillus colini TaxID=1819254 RepID=A0ABS4MF18_9LACO|nr:nitronate monooxygenase [Lactobacillus colini]MBP2058244.1 enoyl-[acyl-carrier protein] reductase II [Lactobacillus colini]
MVNRVTKVIGTEKPIIQASMFYLTDAKLVAAVSNAGGLGIIGMSAGIDHYEANIEKSLAFTKQEIEKTKKLTNKPFGLTISPMPIKKKTVDTSSGASQNSDKTTDIKDLGKAILSADKNSNEELGLDADLLTNGLLNLAKEENIKVVMWSGIFIPGWVERFHDAGIKVLFRPMDPEPTVIKNAIKGGVDAIIATGFDEGGTVPSKTVGTFSAIPMAVDATEDKVPVIAAGGITDERTAKAAFALGAEGIYAGTAFLASKEAPMAQNIKERMLTTNAEEMLMFRAPNSFYRSLSGELPDKLVEMDKAGATANEIWDAAGGYDDLRQGMLFGKLDKGIASFGLGISMIHEIEPVEVIVNRLYAGIPEDAR